MKLTRREEGLLGRRVIEKSGSGGPGFGSGTVVGFRILEGRRCAQVRFDKVDKSGNSGVFLEVSNLVLQGSNRGTAPDWDAWWYHARGRYRR